MDISGVLNQVKSGGFVNPISSKVQVTLDQLTIPTLQQFKDSAAIQYAAASLPVAPALNLEAAYSKITDSYNQINELLGHSDRLSGVNLSGNGTLATIAKTMTYAKSVNGENSCASVLAAFGTIMKANELVSDTLNTIFAIKSLIDDIPRQIDAIPGQLQAYAEKISSQIIDDGAALAAGQITLLQNSVAQNLVSLFQDECAAQILSSVMGQEMKNEVEKVSNSAKSAAANAIFGR